MAQEPVILIILHYGLTHATMLTEDFDEVKSVEAQQQHQLVLTFSIIARSLWNTDRQWMN